MHRPQAGRQNFGALPAAMSMVSLARPGQAAPSARAAGSSPPSLALRARTMRDCACSVELCVSAIDALIAMSGTAAFTATHSIQRAWRDIHFASMHVSLNPEQNFAHFGRTVLGLPRDSHQPFF